MNLDNVQHNGLPAPAPLSGKQQAKVDRILSKAGKCFRLPKTDTTDCQEQDSVDSERVADVQQPNSNTVGKCTKPPTDYLRYSNKTITIDYLSVTYDEAGYQKVISILCRFFGGGTQTNSNARTLQYRKHISWDQHPGVFLHRDPCHEKGPKVFTVVVPGGPLTELEPHQRYSLTNQLLSVALLRNVPRLDLAVDVRCETGVGLIKDLRQSMKRDEIGRIKSFADHITYGRRGLITGHTFSMGKRGAVGSGRYIRVYDKGLETQTLPRGQWERFEVEFTDETAKLVAEELRTSKDFERTAFDLVCGSLTVYKRPPGKSFEVARSRLKPSPYWKAFCAGSTPMFKRPEQQIRSLERTVHHLRTNSGIAKLAKAGLANGQTRDQILDNLEGVAFEKLHMAPWTPADDVAAREYRELFMQEDPKQAS